MSKRRKRRPRPAHPHGEVQSPREVGHEQTLAPGRAGTGTLGRNQALDTLRGLAIALMIVDHVAGIVLGLTIQESKVRLLTRLAMPLFCVLMGYFLREDRRFQWRRPAQILAAAVAANLLFWPYYGSIEILGTLLLAYLAFVLSGRFFPICVLAIVLYPVDPLRAWFDFPPSIVISFVAQGALLRRYGIAAALVGGTWLASGTIWIDALEPTGVNQKLCLFVLPATLLIFLGISSPTKRIAGLDWIGRHPLSIYVGQYYVIFGLAAIV